MSDLNEYVQGQEVDRFFRKHHKTCTTKAQVLYWNPDDSVGLECLVCGETKVITGFTNKK